MATSTSGNVSGINFGIGTYTDNASITSTFASLQKKIEDQAKSFTIGPEMERAALIQAGREEQSKKEFGYIRERIEANEREFQQWYQQEQQREAIAEAAFQKWYQLELRKEEIRERISQPATATGDDDARSIWWQNYKARLRAEELAGEQRAIELADRNKALAVTHQQWDADKSAQDAAQQANAQWLTMQAARRNADPYAAGGKSPFMSTADKIQEQVAREQAERTANIISTVRQQGADAEKRRVAEATRHTEGIIGTIREQEFRAQERRFIERQRDHFTRDEVEQTRHARNVSRIVNETLEEQANLATSGGGRKSWQVGLTPAEQRRRDAASAHSAGKGGQIIQEFGRGFEDFLVSASMGKNTTEAIALGMRGAANNVSQLASYMGPVAGAMVAIGASASVVIVPAIMRWLDNSKELEKSQKKIEESMKNQEGSAARRFAFFEKTSSLSGAKSEFETQKTAVAALREERDMLENRKFKAFQIAMDAGQDPQKFLQETNAKILNNDEEMAKAKFLYLQAQKVLEIRTKEETLKDNREHEQEFNKWVADQKEQRRQEELKAMDEQFKFMQAAEKAHLDGQIDTQQAAVDDLQERIQKAGNAAGPSAAMMRGTQAAEQVISRAIAGTRSQEDTMKAQLKVQQDMLKQLQKQKQAPVATI